MRVMFELAKANSASGTRWITIHPNGAGKIVGKKNGKTTEHSDYRRILIDESGRIVGGDVPKHWHGNSVDKIGKIVEGHPYHVGSTVTYQRPGSNKKLSGTVKHVYGDTLTVDVKGSNVKVPVSHVMPGHQTSAPSGMTAPRNPFNNEPPGGWTEADKVPDTHRKNAPEPQTPKHKVGTQIHYTGDQANHSGTFEVDKVHHFEGNPYYDLKEVGGGRRFNRVGEYQIHDEKRAGTRFLPKDTHDKERERLRKEAEEKNRKFLDEQRAKRDSEAQSKQEQPKPKIAGPFSEMDASRYNNTTHWPTTADKLNQQHSEQVQTDRERAMAQLKRYGVDGMPSDVRDALKRLAGAHEHFMREQIRSREVAPPWTVTGRAKYNGRPDKADAITRNAIEKVENAKKHLGHTLKQYSPNRPVSADEHDAVQQLQAKIDEAEKMQEKYKKINSVFRKKKLTDDQKVEEMMKLGIGEKLARQALEPDYMGRIGIPSYMLQNNLANVKRMKARVEELSRKRSDTSTSHEFDGGIIHDNVDDNRVQIFFDGKPDAETRAKLKSRGFHWSPTAAGPNGEKGAWQRMRSPEAMRIAQRVTGGEEVSKSMRTKSEWREVKRSKRDRYGADEVFADPRHDSYPLTKNGKPSRERTLAAWRYIHTKEDRSKYSKEDLERVEARIRRFAKKHFGLVLKDAEMKKSFTIVFPIAK